MKTKNTETKVSQAKPKPSRKTVDQAKQAIAKLRQTALALPSPAPVAELATLPLDEIHIREQIRETFDADRLAELAADIAARGILQPLTVRRACNGYILVAGERRLRAARLANLASVPVIVQNLDEEEHRLAQIAENIQREDLSLAEEAKAITALYDALGSVKAVAEKLHKSVAWVSKRMSLARGLGSYASALLADGITEDLELIQAVDKLDKATPGTNSAWALCEKIRKGDAGRTEAREALARVTEEKKQSQQRLIPKAMTPEEIQRKVQEQDMQPSNAFRYWLNHSHPWLSAEYIRILAHDLADDKSGLLHQLAIIEEMQANLATRQTALLEKLRTECRAIAKQTGALMQHTAFERYQREQRQ